MFLGFFIPTLVIFLILGAVWRGKPGFQKEYQDQVKGKVEGLPDLLRHYRPINDRVIQLKNGELMAGFYYRGVDLDSSSNHEVLAIIGRLNSALCRFGSGWMMHVDNARKYALEYRSENDFPDPVLVLMNEERKAQFTSEGTHHDSQQAVFLTWMPPSRLESKAASIVYETTDAKVLTDEDLSEKSLIFFENALDDFERTFKSVMHEVTRIVRGPWIKDTNGAEYAFDELASYINFCITGEQKPIRVYKGQRIDLDYLVGSYDFTGGNSPRVNGKHIRVVCVEGTPSAAAPMVMDYLNGLQVRYRWTTRLIFQDTRNAQARIDKIMKFWRQKVVPMVDAVMGNNSGRIDTDAAGMAADALVAKNELESGEVKAADYTCTVVLIDEDEIKVADAAKYVEKIFSDVLGFPARVEEPNSVEAYLGSLPGHGYENIREMPMHTIQVAYLFPSTATWSGVQKHPCKWYPKDAAPLFLANSTGGTPFAGVMHVDDIGHGFGVGGTGSGKSTAVQFLIARQFQYKWASVHLFEKGYSGVALCDGIRGRHYDIGSDTWQGGFAPLAEVDTVQGRRWATDYIETLCQLLDYKLTPDDLADVKATLKKLGSEPLDSRTMTGFVQLLNRKHLRQILNFYTVDGDNHFIDKRPSEENVGFGLYTVYEMEHLMELGEKHVVPILLYLLRKIERSLKGKPTLIILDEAWLMLQHELFKAFIKKWLKTMRKANCGVWFFTQELKDLAESSLRDVIYSSCPTRLFLANPDAKSDAQKPLYKALGLNDQQIDLIAGATKKRDYYYVSEYGKRMFQLELGPMNLAFAGVSGKEEVAELRALQRKYGDKNWQVEWVRRRAGDDWAKALRFLYEREAKNDEAFNDGDGAMRRVS